MKKEINWGKVCLDLSLIFELPKLEPYGFSNSPFTDNLTYFRLQGKKLKSKRERRNKTQIFFSNSNGQFTSLLDVDRANRGKFKRITSLWNWDFTDFKKESYWLMCYAQSLGFDIDFLEGMIKSNFSNHDILEFYLGYQERVKELGSHLYFLENLTRRNTA